MTALTFLSRWRSRLGAFGADRRGVSAVEFAILLPVMIAMYLGSVEMTEGISISQQVSQTASTVANLVAEKTNACSPNCGSYSPTGCNSSTVPESYAQIQDAEMSDILQATQAVMTPYPVANSTVVVSAINIDCQGNAKVAWSETLNGSARPVGQVVTLPAGLSPGICSSVILGESSYGFTPNLGYIITGTVTLSGSMYYAPRNVTFITRPNYTNPPCT